jgi:type IV fimbrial biogenesis protein FimT
MGNLTIYKNQQIMRLFGASKTVIARMPADLRRLGKSAGFTLMELMVVVAIVAILAMLAVPSFTQFINNTRLSSTHSQLVNDLNYARSDAIKRNSRTLICVRNADATGCANTTNWGAGWLVCADNDSDGACDASTATMPNPSKVQAPLNSALTLTASSAVIRFNANGSQGAPGSISTLTLSTSGATTRTLNIAPSGGISK